MPRRPLLQTLLVVLALGWVGGPVLAGVEEAREYLAKAQERLAAHDVLVVEIGRAHV